MSAPLCPASISGSPLASLGGIDCSGVAVPAPVPAVPPASVGHRLRAQLQAAGHVRWRGV